MASRDQIRLLVVEDVPQVAQYIRNLLTAQAVVKLLDEGAIEKVESRYYPAG